jgi:DNA-binding beta-propeller fold protein YncE
VTTEPADDDGPDFLAEAEIGDRRRQGLAAARRTTRSQALQRWAPWIVVALLVVSACVAGVMAWREAAPGIGGPTEMAALEGTVTVLPAILSADGTVTQPVGVAVSGDRLYVADGRRGLVDVLTRDGSHIATIGAGFLKAPAYVAVGPVDGRLYVTDRERDQVVVFSATGKLVRVLGPGGIDPTSTAFPSWRPLGIGFAPDGTLYVTDTSDSQQVVVFSPIGRRIGAFGQGLPAGRTGEPLSFANGVCATDDTVLVTDSNNGRVLVLDRQGAFIRGLLTGGLPRGIAALPDGRFVVADAALGVVRSYSAAGQQTSEAGGAGETAGMFVTPSGVALSEDGRVFVGDTGNGRVDVLRMPDAASRAASAVPSSGSWTIALIALLIAAAVAAAVAIGLSRRSVHAATS